jgi:hypothetical protein
MGFHRVVSHMLQAALSSTSLAPLGPAELRLLASAHQPQSQGQPSFSPARSPGQAGDLPKPRVTKHPGLDGNRVVFPALIRKNLPSPLRKLLIFSNFGGPALTLLRKGNDLRNMHSGSFRLSLSKAKF